MQLDWVMDYTENRLTFEIDNLRYTTVDGGQNIYKYVDGVETTRLRQFPNMPDDYLAPSQSPPVEAPAEDEWADELVELIKTYPAELGEFLPSTEFMQQDGTLKDFGVELGLGRNNAIDKLSVNRMGIPSSVQERWGWEQVAGSDTPTENSIHGLVWLKHSTTGEVIRAGASQCVPCHVFPKVEVPIVIDPADFEQDVQDFGGTIGAGI